jgi:uncharacterized protein
MYEWDENKNATNIEKHGVSFTTASRIFEDRVVTFPDDRFDYGEKREISIGQIDGVLLLTVIHTGRDGKTRIISARRANGAERKRYEEALR